ncbi:RHO protein GDP dissociation inhibitor [Penicillium paradoxum]|uniref:RHO protein GDP dissociation inhibitor n=1 Tax=Penicillium paradoxum TaxID=176176 RepID=UPI0025477E98|nr:RHO protein GDP dissociation inhibitor [Penicillium paradoxum]KAJ5782909.1 RHO protein GDP dissociation inhibitor [Penicillium paradoxum]
MTDHEEDLAATRTEGFRVGEKKTLDEYNQLANQSLLFPALDKDDEAMNRWKASLGLNTGEPIADPNDPRKCIINLKDKPFKIKEGAKFHIKVTFQVHHEVLSGLKYLQVVKRKGIRVSKDEEMLGSYAPNTTSKVDYSKEFNEEEAPTGMIARGHYNAVSKFIDDDDHTHLLFEWSFDIAKDW